MAVDLGRYGIRVVTIAPGLFATPLSSLAPAKQREQIVEYGMAFPKRLGSPKEFAMTVKYILDCSYLNGEVIRISASENVPIKMSKL
jgi:NAD(P)-dependent dehydrogenase (short-subunit alcohol dehydrogenase family)